MHEWLTSACEKALGIRLTSLKPLHGGDINLAYLLETNKQPVFAKVNNTELADSILSAEQKGLDQIRSTGAIRCPEILGFYSDSKGAVLFLQFIKPGHPSPDFWKAFGTSLAALHRSGSQEYGLGYSNYLGSLIQENTPEKSWASFFIEHRIKPQVKMAYSARWLFQEELDLFQRLYEQILNVIPEERPSLIHGDLWSGNFLCNRSQQPILIDPAVSYSHREMDIAMTRLFGGFNRQFYQAYEAAWPFYAGFEERVSLYQLYYLLAHLNLFGKGYYNSVMKVVNSYL